MPEKTMTIAEILKEMEHLSRSASFMSERNKKRYAELMDELRAMQKPKPIVEREPLPPKEDALKKIRRIFGNDR